MRSNREIKIGIVAELNKVSFCVWFCLFVCVMLLSLLLLLLVCCECTILVILETSFGNLLSRTLTFALTFL
jgi:hypothetical protein